MSDEHCKGLCDISSPVSFCFGCHRSLEQRYRGDPSPLDSGELHPAFESDLNADFDDDFDNLDDIGCSDISI